MRKFRLQPKKLTNYNDAWNYCLWLLARKNYTASEIRQKLSRRQLNVDIIQQAIDRLLELKLLDDNAYAKIFIENRIRLNPKGKMAIKYELKRKGIPLADTDAIMNEMTFDEKSLAHDLLRKLKKRWQKLPLEKQKARCLQHLAARGFNPEIIYNILHKDF